ncbi:pre-mRNA-splicing factor cwc22, partial [Coemansia sp. RSA 2399]
PSLSANAVISAVVAGAATSTSMRGRYMPPSMRRQMMAAAAKAAGSSEQARAEVEQRESWEALKKRINGPINKVNTSNIKEIVVELFSANLIRGRGLFCRSVIKAQSLSRPFTPVYAALAAVINTKLPIVGELLLTRLVLQFRRAFNRDEKDRCLSAIMFIAHLTNQRVAHEVLALQALTLLLENPTDDSVEIAVAFMREVGALLAEIVPRVLNAVFDTFRSILHDADIDKRVQYMIEVLFQYRRDGFKNNPVIPDGLDLVEIEEQIIHE